MTISVTFSKSDATESVTRIFKTSRDFFSASSMTWQHVMMVNFALIGYYLHKSSAISVGFASILEK